MRAVMIAVLLLALAIALPSGAAQAQSVSGTEAQTLRDEIRRLNDRLDKLQEPSAPQAVPQRNAGMETRYSSPAPTAIPAFRPGDGNP